MYIFFGDMHCSEFRRCANLRFILIFRRCAIAPTLAILVGQATFSFDGQLRMLFSLLSFSRLGVKIGFMSECLDFWRHHLKGLKSEKQETAPGLIWFQCHGDIPPGLMNM